MLSCKSRHSPPGLFEAEGRSWGVEGENLMVNNSESMMNVTIFVGIGSWLE